MHVLLLVVVALAIVTLVIETLVETLVVKVLDNWASLVTCVRAIVDHI